MQIKIHKNRHDWKEYFFLVMICVCIFLNGYFKYSDELVTLTVIFGGLIKWTIYDGQDEKKFVVRILLLYIVLFFIGIISNMISGSQSSIIAIILDGFEWSKFILVFAFGLLLIKEKKVYVYYYDAIKIAKILIIYAVTIYILNIILDLGLARGFDRFGIRAYTFFGVHVAFTVAMLVSSISVLLIERYRNRYWILVAVIMCLLTLRSKAIGYVTLVICCYMFMRKRLYFRRVIPIVLLTVFVVRDRISRYFGIATTPRAILLRVGIDIAKKNFPFGSGWASFGTSVSASYYSRVYSIYGLSERFGFTHSNPHYLEDGGWATQFGEFGILGTLIFLIILALLFDYVRKNTKHVDNILPWFSILGYIMIASTSESPFCSNYSAILALMLIIIVKYIRNLELPIESSGSA